MYVGIGSIPISFFFDRVSVLSFFADLGFRFVSCLRCAIMQLEIEYYVSVSFFFFSLLLASFNNGSSFFVQ